METVENAYIKLDEAVFFLQLMDRIELDRKALTDEREPIKEFGYLLSAFLNACYSCTEHLKQPKANRDRVAAFTKRHAQFYKSGPSGGWRTQAVHFRNVEPGSDGYHPPPGDNVILRSREKAARKDSTRNTALSIGLGYFYFSDFTPQNTICDLCAVQVEDIRQLIEECS